MLGLKVMIRKIKIFESLKGLKSVNVFLFSIFEDVFKVISMLMIHKNIKSKIIYI